MLAVEHFDAVEKKFFYSLPGGGIEEGEDAWQAACRETLEETGYQVVQAGRNSFQNSYLFRFNGREHLCNTTWFAARLQSKRRWPHAGDKNVISSAWLEVDSITRHLSYHPVILQSVRRLLPVFS